MKVQPKIAMNGDKTDCKHVFVCGLPRSGTSMFGRNVARLEGCTGFKNTGVLEDEGQFLQDVYGSDHEHGGAGGFGFDSRSHLTETSELLTPQNALKLRRCWETYWDASKSIRVEKTPGNLLMTRFLQAVFPNSYFIVMKRHPVAVSMATQKWKGSVRSLNHLFKHWLHCHALFEEDKKHLKHVYELKYEDYVENPGKYHEEIAAFIGTHVPEAPQEDKFRYVVEWRNPVGLRVPEEVMEATSAVHNKKYLDRWRKLLTDSIFRHYYRHIARKYEQKFTKYGYSLINVSDQHGDMLDGKEYLTDVLGPLYCLSADCLALMRRMSTQTMEQLRIHSKRILPGFVIEKVRQARQGALLRVP